ncbi:hypothetical protein LO763_14075 [Glycomyces sp. A-F 0318]|uniref:hypothetical protein n=1 Tax=Glycomyces amatae TaxID=2881355 RepID=UPI001E28F573|nr:hypothetical protein [Glycomyces amatae]MCD0444745.1 hypothetical protein [Glycomyces amatae]
MSAAMAPAGAALTGLIMALEGLEVVLSEHIEDLDQETVSDDDAAAAADDLTAAIAYERDLHRQADAKAIGTFTVVGLIIAATSATFSHIDGVLQDVVAIGLAMVIAGGITSGITLIPLNAPLRAASAEEAQKLVLKRARDPRFRLNAASTELWRLEKITRAKNRLMVSSLILLGVGAYLIGTVLFLFVF